MLLWLALLIELTWSLFDTLFYVGFSLLLFMLVLIKYWSFVRSCGSQAQAYEIALLIYQVSEDVGGGFWLEVSFGFHAMKTSSMLNVL